MDQVFERKVQRRESDGQILSLDSLTDAHLAPIIKIAQESFDVVWSEKEFTELLKNPDSVAKGAFYGGELVGYFFGIDIQGDLDIITLATSKRFRQLGIATLLLNTVLKNVRGEAFLEVDLRNDAALAFYRKAGFIEGRIRKAYYQNKYDALCMSLVVG